jgi:hypothetical protein
MSLIRVKKSFTLIELIIVILIISVTYLLIFSNVSFNTKNKEEKVTLYNLEDFLFLGMKSVLCIYKKEDLIDGKMDININVNRSYDFKI